MKKDEMDPIELRRRAEERLRGRPTNQSARLRHELDVHQIELELQNEELHAARDAMEASLALYSELFDFAPIGYVTLSAEGVIRDVNHAGARVLGVARSQLTGKRFMARVEGKDQIRLGTILQRALDGDEAVACEIGLVTSNGEKLDALLTATVVATRSDVLTLVAFEDITQQKAREAALARTEQALRDANQRKDEFLAMLSHELRNPLAPIRNSLDVLSHVEAGSETALRAQTIIDRQVTHLTRLIDDLLDVTRITRGKVRLSRVRVDLGEIARRTMEDHRATFEARGVVLTSDLDAGQFWIDADSARIIQTLSNILGNAEKFTPRGGSVLVSLQRSGAQAVLRVRDNGAGIPESLQAHLFEPFAQGPQTMERDHGGLGLGLAMVKGLVELHGGGVAIASDGPGRGTEITVTLPLAPAPAPQAHSVAPSAASSLRVLVIEDNHDAAESLMAVLACSGHDVHVAHDGPAAIELARGLRPQVVICDIGLPGMNGYAVARAMRADPLLRAAFLIALSGYAQADDLERAADAGFDRHLAKPASGEQMARLLAEVAPARDGVSSS